MSFLGFGSTKSLTPEDPKLLGTNVERAPTNESARVLPWFSGTRWLGVTWIGNVFGVRTDPIRARVGKKKQTVGYNYYASFAALICNGIVDRITRIRFDEKTVWTGDITRNEEDSVNITISGYGILTFYFGTETQTINAALAASGQEHSAYRGQCYIVGNTILFGQDRTTAPAIQVEVSRYPRFSWLADSRVQQADDTLHYDVNPAAVLAEWWTDPRFGSGLAQADLDITKLQAAAATLLGERIGVSPFINSQLDFKDALIRLFEHCDAYPTSDGGKLGFELVRPPSYEPQIVGADELVTDPNLAIQGWEDTFNETRVKFPDYKKEGQDSTAKFHDLANFQITGRPKAQAIDRPWVTIYPVAEKIASALGRIDGLPQLSGTMRVLSGTAGDLQVGDVFQYATRDNQVVQLRVVSRTEPKPMDREIDITFESDRGWANVEHFAAGEDTIPETPEFDPSEPAATDVLDAPYAFSDPTKNSLIFMAARGDLYTTAFDVWKAATLAGSYESAASRNVPPDLFQTFAAKCILKTDHLADTPLLDEIGFEFELDCPDGSALDDEQDLESALNHELLALFGVGDTAEIMALYEVTILSATRYSCKAVRGLYDTRRRHQIPETEFWIQRRDKLNVNTWAPYVNAARYYKFQMVFAAAEIELSAITGQSHTENARSLRAIAPGNLMANGDGVAPTWTNGGSNVSLTWTNTSRAATDLRALEDDFATDLTMVEFQIWNQDETTLRDTLQTTTLTAAYTLTQAQMIAWGDDAFVVRCYGWRGEWKSFDYSRILVIKEN